MRRVIVFPPAAPCIQVAAGDPAMKTIQRRVLVTRAAALLALPVVAGCVAAPPPMPYPPLPPPRAEVPPPRGRPGEVLQPGHWHWDGREYVWNPGRWMVRPPRTERFVEGHWHFEGRGWVWVPGHWV
jgi:hypothetical protein